MEKLTSQTESPYEAPVIRDLGSIAELTEAQGFTGVEDGGSKALIHHSGPMV